VETGSEDKAAYLAAAEEEDDINMIIKDSVPNSDAYAAYTYRVKGINERNKIGDYDMDHDDPHMSEE